MNDVDGRIHARENLCEQTSLAVHDVVADAVEANAGVGGFAEQDAGTGAVGGEVEYELVDDPAELAMRIGRVRERLAEGGSNILCEALEGRGEDVVLTGEVLVEGAAAGACGFDEHGNGGGPGSRC
jgi:hypothetical protein